ncbi:MAG TPA: MFS transporter [Anaerolineaceae bacterium]|nr:MFS transporter [Anaerolineaceae bacterium]
MNSSNKVHTPIPVRTWFVIGILYLSGQIAWGVENAWFNTFVFDTLTPDPRPIAWMVAISAITATVTTLLIGTLSDRTYTRLGRRRPYILFGYILWGIVTALFPMVSLLRPIGLAVFMVILADAIMTFFGSTANDANFNAWTTDITDKTNRGRVEGLIQMSVFVSFIITTALAGMVIEQFGYFVFFYGLGGLVALTGFIGGLMLKDAPVSEEERNQQRLPYWREVLNIFRFSIVRENKILFLLFLAILVNGIAWQVTFPYLLIYIEHFLGYDKGTMGLIMGGVLIITAISTIPIGMLVDRVSRRTFILWVAFSAAVTALIFSFARGIPSLLIAGTLQTVTMAAFGIVSGAWLKDLYPSQQRGQFQGVRMVFWVLLPMVIGPAIGSFLIRSFGIPTTLNGEAGFIPTPVIYYAAALINLLALLPLIRIPKQTSLVEIIE